jgi:hypothetical protein
MDDIGLGTAVAVFLIGATCGPLLLALARAVKVRVRAFLLSPDLQTGVEKDPYFNREYAKPQARRKSAQRAS